MSPSHQIYGNPKMYHEIYGRTLSDNNRIYGYDKVDEFSN
jgi:hypothetical protein